MMGWLSSLVVSFFVFIGAALGLGHPHSAVPLYVPAAPTSASSSSSAASSCPSTSPTASSTAQLWQQCQHSSVAICAFVDATDIGEIDPSTLTLLCGPDGSATNFAKDNNHVYAFYVDGPAVLPGADPASFQVIDSYPNQWVKDKYHVWWDLQLVDSADPSTFVVLPHGQYAKDSKHVFWTNGIIPGADPASFSFFASGFYAHDHAHVYFVGSSVPNADPSTFMDLGNGYGKDQQHVWYFGTILSGADPATFETVKDPSQKIDARDKNRTYQEGSTVS